jgi:Major Facilitator Superfamily
LSDLVPLYPLYPLLFADSGLSGGQIASLFVLWSVASVVLEVPSGALADMVSRRALLLVGALLPAIGFGLWTFVPGYSVFAAGFLLWAAGGALHSGTLEALVHDELAAIGAESEYQRLSARAYTASIAAMIAGTASAGPLFAWGGYPAVGVVSVITAIATGLVALTFPDRPKVTAAERPTVTAAERPTVTDAEPPTATDAERLTDAEPPTVTDAEPPKVTAEPPIVTAAGEPGGVRAWYGMLRSGLAEAAGVRRVRRLVLLAALVPGFGALDEFFSLLAESTGAAVATVPLLVAVTAIGQLVGSASAGLPARGRTVGLATTVGALAIIAGALSGSPWGLLLVAAGYGMWQHCAVVADARLQAAIRGPARATVTSVAGLGAELAAIMLYVAWGLAVGPLGDGPAVALTAVPLAAIGLLAACWLGNPGSKR